MTTETKRTATLVVNPSNEVKILSFKAEVDKIQEYIVSMEVESPAQVKTMTDDLASVMTLKSAIEEERKRYTGPINVHLNSINSLFHTLTDPLERITKLGKQKIKDYTMEQERIRQLEELTARSAAMAAVALATPVDQVDSSTGEITTVPVLPIVNAPAETQTKFRADLATASQKMVAKYRVINFKVLSDDYKMADDAFIKDVLKKGKRDIEGLEIWEEPEISIRRRQ